MKQSSCLISTPSTGMLRQSRLWQLQECLVSVSLKEAAGFAPSAIRVHIWTTRGQSPLFLPKHNSGPAESQAEDLKTASSQLMQMFLPGYQRNQLQLSRRSEF